ncbi:hypothetical protein PIB30_072922 [Stylosanthes scabra]|uniref:Uncharacterized protein n=1 Tax=Stylosanthes scabra TaxID=79078 RepID=A0ABU6VR31_9FABA|nr:hypothetical protein [Stylosanthes scabra]
MSEEDEVLTWRASVSIVCFIFVQYHPAVLVKRRFGFEQPIPVDPVNLDKFLKFNARGEDQWWPTKLEEYYSHWREWKTEDHQIRVVYTPDATIPTQEVAKLPANAPPRATQPRDPIVLPTDAPLEEGASDGAGWTVEAVGRGGHERGGRVQSAGGYSRGG